jgi:hypothetical protein
MATVIESRSRRGGLRPRGGQARRRGAFTLPFLKASTQRGAFARKGELATEASHDTTRTGTTTTGADPGKRRP